MSLSDPTPDLTYYKKEHLYSLDEYLRMSESVYPDIIPGTEKKVLWAHATQEKTKLSFVYLHGFSASRREISPLVENLGEQFGANIFMTRYSGHGRTDDALKEGSVRKWLKDTEEALEIGEHIGENVVVIACSFGATLLTQHVLRYGVNNTVAACIFLSPNFGLKNKNTTLLKIPFGIELAKLFNGSYRSFEPQNEDHATYWTNRYPLEALLPLIESTSFVQKQSKQSFTIPLLTLFSPNDTVVDSYLIKKHLADFGSSINKQIEINLPNSHDHHILAGDILARENTSFVQEHIRSFIKELSI